jgi:hypothetical protein
MTRKLTILHLSDLHFGSHHAYVPEDIATETDPPSLQTALISDLTELGVRSDFVVVSGDLTSTASPDEFFQAEDFLNQLKRVNRPQRKQRVIVAPGNHDILWQEPDEQISPMPSGKGHENYIRFQHRWRSRRDDPPERASYWEFYEKDTRKGVGLPFNVAFMVLDSCTIEARGETAGIGYVGSQYRELKKTLEPRILASPAPCLKIAVLHHHLLPVAALEPMPPPGKRFSLVRDAAVLLENLIADGYHLVLHGHKHDPYYALEKREHNFSDHDDMGILLVAAGTSGARDDRGSLGRLHYNLIDVEMTGATDSYTSFLVRIRSRCAEEREPLRGFVAHKTLSVHLDRTVPLHRHLQLVSNASAVIVKDILERLVQMLQIEARDLPLRANWLLVDQSSHKLFIADTYGTPQMRDRPDEHIELRLGAGCAGVAWTSRETVRADLRGMDPLQLQEFWRLTEEQIELTRDLRYVLSTPVFDAGGKILGILSVDTVDDTAVDVLDSERAGELVEIAARLLCKAMSVLLPEKH